MNHRVEFIGSAYGGFPCCLALLNQESVVLDFGVGEDISFALGLHEKVGCNIELFDFTPDSISWFGENYSTLKYLNYNTYGISDFDGMHEVYDYGGGISRRSSWMGYEANEKYQVKSISTIMKEKNIDKIDLLKLDIEGEEYKVIPDIISSGIYPNQLCVEHHARFLDNTELHNKVFYDLLNYYDCVGVVNNESCFILK